MRLETHRRLAELRRAKGMEYGKLVQKLLALALLDAGAKRVVERGVQGIDLEATLADGRRVALEVKTTEGDGVKLGEKDLAGLEGRRGDGFAPHLAVLGPHLLDAWMLVPVVAGEIRAQVGYPPLLLRAWRDPVLSALVGEPFARAVDAHAAAASVGGQGALDALLRAHPGYVLA